MIRALLSEEAQKFIKENPIMINEFIMKNILSERGYMTFLYYVLQQKNKIEDK